MTYSNIDFQTYTHLIRIANFSLLKRSTQKEEIDWDCTVERIDWFFAEPSLSQKRVLSEFHFWDEAHRKRRTIENALPKEPRVGFSQSLRWRRREFHFWDEAHRKKRPIESALPKGPRAGVSQGRIRGIQDTYKLQKGDEGAASPWCTERTPSGWNVESATTSAALSRARRSRRFGCWTSAHAHHAL